MSVILGIDPGSRRTGFGVIEVRPRPIYVTSGVIRLPDLPLAERLRVIADSIAEIVAAHRPQQLAIEEVFMARNAASALKLGQARGAAIVACAQQGLAVSEYTARQVKLAVVGHGGASKQQIQHMVRTLLGLPAAPQEDAADALACALCHAHTRATVANMGPALGGLQGRMRGGRMAR